MSDEILVDGKPVDLEDISIEQKFNAVKNADDAPSIRKPEPKPKPAPRTRARRTDRAAKPRTDKKPAEPLTPKDFRQALDGAVDGLWLAAASIPYATPYAIVLEASKPALVANLNQAANHSPRARSYVEKMTAGGGGMWAVGLAVTGASMASTALQIAKDPELRAQAAEHTKARLSEYMKQFKNELPLDQQESPDDNPAG